MKTPDIKHILQWSLPSAKPRYLAGMSSDGPTTTITRRLAVVFDSKRQAMRHPANAHPGCGFKPEPLKRQ